jgi:hypothetical protein
MFPTIPQMKWDVKNLEHEILIRCLYLDTGAATIEGCRAALGRVTDWEAVSRMALDHGVFPSLYQRVAETSPAAVPPEVLVNWRRLYKTYTRRNLRLTGELLRVLALLKSRGIIAIPIKGPVLAQVAYGDVSLRQFGDLDLLVRRPDMAAVKKLLMELGYTPSPRLSPKQEIAHLKYNHELSFFHPHWTMLDVHWRFADFPGGGLDPESVFDRKVVVRLQGKPVYSLGPEDMLLMLCQHGTFHLWFNLATVADVARLVESQPSWDWPGLMQRAQETGLRRRLLLGLTLARELLGAPLPPEIVAQIERDAALPVLRQPALGQIFGGAQADGLRERLERNLFHVRIRERLQDKLTYVRVRATAPAEEDWRWVSLPDSCYWLYYLARPCRLLVQGVIQPRRWFLTS